MPAIMMGGGTWLFETIHWIASMFVSKSNHALGPNGVGFWRNALCLIGFSVMLFPWFVNLLWLFKAVG